VEQRGEELGVVSEIARLWRRPTGGQVALVEEQVDHRENLAEAVADLVGGRDPVRDPRLADLAFGAGDALTDGGLRNEERSGDLGGGQPAHHPQRERDLPRAREGGVTAGEDQPQPVVGLRLGRPRHQGELVAVAALATQQVEAAATGHGVQPGIRPVRDAVDRPVRQRGLDGVGDQVFGGGEVTDQVHEGRGQPARVVADHAGQLGMARLAHEAMGRISTTGHAGQDLARRSASSRSATSIST
jgi:hypothetical protein